MFGGGADSAVGDAARTESVWVILLGKFSIVGSGKLPGCIQRKAESAIGFLQGILLIIESVFSNRLLLSSIIEGCLNP